MGKWIATDHYHDGRWMIMKEGGKDVANMSKDLATRYALALNIVDAGVDLGEFPMRLLHFRGYRHRSESPNATSSETMHKFFEALTYFEAIANAVEGERKVDV